MVCRSVADVHLAYTLPQTLGLTISQWSLDLLRQAGLHTLPFEHSLVIGFPGLGPLLADLGLGRAPT